MITKAVLSFFASLLSGVWSALPSGSSLGVNSIAGDLTSSGVFNHVGWLNDYIPVDDATTVVLLLLALFVFMSVVRIVLWVLTKSHLLGGGAGE